MLQLPSSGLEYILEKKLPIFFFSFLLPSIKSETGVHFAQGQQGQVILKTESQLAQLVPSLDFNPRAFSFPSSFLEHFFNPITEFQSRKLCL